MDLFILDLREKIDDLQSQIYIYIYIIMYFNQYHLEFINANTNIYQVLFYT